MKQTILALFAMSLAVGPVNFVGRTTASTRIAQRDLTKADVDRMMVEISNWGRWGKDDQLGAINLITPATRKRAAALVREGVSISLARETNTEKADDNSEPYEHTMTMTGAN